MMSPLVALDAESRLVAAAGAAGGSRIRPALVQTLLRVLRGTAPRALSTQPRLNALPDLVRLEPGFDAAVVPRPRGRRDPDRDRRRASTRTSAASPP